MSVIIGLAENGKVYMGADSCTTAGWEMRTTTFPKVIERNEFLIGHVGSVRMGNLLQYTVQFDSPNEGEDDRAYMIRAFVEPVRKCFKEYGVVKTESGVDTCAGGKFLVAYRKHLYSIDNDFQIGETGDNMESHGSGREYALGAMAAYSTMPPRERVLSSLAVSAQFSRYVTPPFIILESK